MVDLYLPAVEIDLQQLLKNWKDLWSNRWQDPIV